jgi:hypothetical protein
LVDLKIDEMTTFVTAAAGTRARAAVPKIRSDLA